MKKSWYLVVFSVLMVACSTQAPVTAAPTSTPEVVVVEATVTPLVVVKDTPVVFAAPVVQMSVSEMILGDLASDVWRCQKVSLDGKKCLDERKNSPVIHTINSIYGEPNPQINIQSRDLTQGKLGILPVLNEKKFEVKVEDTIQVADYGQCIVSSVSYEVIKDHTSGVRSDSNIVLTICFDGTTWYASMPQ